MRCEMVLQKLPDYVDDDVGSLERIAIEVHVARCGGCRGELNELRNTFDACRGTLAHPNPRDRFDELMRFIRTQDCSRGIVRRVRVCRPRPVMAQMVSAAAVVAILAVSAPFARGAKRLADGIERPNAPLQRVAEAPAVSRGFVRQKARIATACEWCEDQQSANMPLDEESAPLV